MRIRYSSVLARLKRTLENTRARGNSKAEGVSVEQKAAATSKPDMLDAYNTQLLRNWEFRLAAAIEYVAEAKVVGDDGLRDANGDEKTRAIFNLLIAGSVHAPAGQ